MNIQSNKLILWSQWFISISFCTSEKFQMGFFYNLKKKQNLTIKLFKYLREMALRSSNEKNCPLCVGFSNINVNENAFLIMPLHCREGSRLSAECDRLDV